MATTALVETTAQVGEPYRWRRQEYEKMVEIGLFPPQARLELIEGEILHMASQTSYHASALSKAVDALRLIFRAGYHVRSQMPLALSDFSEPEPAIAIVPGTPDDYWKWPIVQSNMTENENWRSMPAVTSLNIGSSISMNTGLRFTANPSKSDTRK